MPFFLIVPAWLLCVLCGIVLLCFQRFRRMGLYAINISTAATAISLLLSTTVLFLALSGTISNLEGVAQCSCLYAILSHRSCLALVRPVRNRFALLSEISPNGALRD